MRRMVSRIMLLVLLIGMLTLTFNVKIAELDESKTVEPVGATDAAVTQAVDWWPKFRHDLSQTGYSTSTAPNTNTTIWKYETEYRVYSSPAVIDGKVYVVSNDGNVHCLNASTGTYIWNYTTGAFSFSSPAVADGKVYIASEDQVHALNASTGTYIWSRGTGSLGFYSPTVVDGRVHVGWTDSYPAMIGCLNSSTGALIWTYTTADDQIRSSAAVVDGRVYVGTYGSRNHRFYCLNASNGAYIWSYGIGLQGVISSPAVFDGRVYFGGGETIYCLNASTGTHIWNYIAGYYVYSSPAVAYGRVYIGSDDRNVYCLNASNGAHMWSYTTGGSVASSPAVADGKVYVGSQDRKVYALNASSGALIWSYKTGDEIVWSSPAVADAIAYIGSSDYKIYAFGLCHDVAVANIAPDKTTAIEGQDVTIDVTAENQGSYTENFNVTAYANTTQVGNQTITNLSSGTNKILSFTWDTTGFAIGNYTISAVADVVANETDTLDNTYIDGIVRVRLPIYDVAVVDVLPGSNIVPKGFDLNIDVAVENQGDFAEAFNVTAYANTTTIEEQEVSLNSGESATLIFTWNTSGFSLGNYTISAHASPVAEETNTGDNTCVDGIVIIRPPGDVAVINAITSKSDCLGVGNGAPYPVLCQGRTAEVYVTVENQGDFTESFNVTVYANDSIIKTYAVTSLASGSQETRTIIWNATGWAKGNYTIKAIAEQVPGEVDTTDNTFVDEWVMVVHPGDLDNSGEVDITDVVMVTAIYRAKIGDPDYNACRDVVEDGEIDIADVVAVTAHYREKDP